MGSREGVKLDDGVAGAAELEAQRRRTFAIISHPDAGKTTLTEKLLLYAGALEEAGAVKARAGRRKSASDWMELEQQRGISVSSTVLRLEYKDHVINLLDTPGHRDFSEDTYRVLTAADAVVMVLDAAKGIEPQTLKLFQVCKDRRMPVMTFLNKCDRPGKDPLALLDEIEEQIGLRPTPLTWPVGELGALVGVIDRRTGDFVRFARSAHGARVTDDERLDPQTAASLFGLEWNEAVEQCSLLDEVGADLDEKSFLAGQSSPLLVGSAATNFGVRQLLDALIELAPSPDPQLDETGEPRSLTAPFSGFVFKMQANMNPAHRDHVAFVRVCSGHFQRGMTLTHGATGKPFTTKYAASVFGAERNTLDEAWPGDIIGLVNAADLRIGDTLYSEVPVTYPAIPAFPVELVAQAQPKDVSRHKQFRRGLEQLEREGVVQVLHRAEGDPAPVLAAVGEMQFEVFVHRLDKEFGAAVELFGRGSRTMRRTDQATAQHLKGIGGVDVLRRRDGVLCALFHSPHWLSRVASDHPDWVLEEITST